jgi:hypothetical protein
MRRLSWLLLVLGTVAFAAAQDHQQDPFQNAPPEEADALRARVNTFYDLFQKGQLREAEAYVAEDSRDVFYNAPKARIFAYEIRSVEFNPDISEAKVLVAVETLSPLSNQPLKQPLPSDWKRIDGKWYLHLDAVQAGETFQSPTGPMHFSQAAGAGGSPPAAYKPPNLASMQTMYDVSNRNLRFNTDGKEVQTQTVKVKNKFQDQLTIEPLTRDFPGMEIQLGSEAIPKDGETTITFTYNPKLARLIGNKHFDFELMPITQRVRIVLSFR